MTAAQRHVEWMAVHYTYSHTGESDQVLKIERVQRVTGSVP